MTKFKNLMVLTSAVFFSSCVGTSQSFEKTSTNASTDVFEVSTYGEKNTAQTSSESFTLVSTKRYYPLNFKTQKAVWFSYIDLADMLTNKTEEQFKTAISEAFENVTNLGLNTVYVHVRPFGDSFYKSEIYPTTRFFTGEVVEELPFDALEIMVQKAHEKGISIHAWINPLRCEKEQYFENYSENFKLKQWYDDEDFFGKYILKVENSTSLWLNPAYIEARQLICDGVREIVENYNVDGVHIDDYFYPTTDENFDKSAFSSTEFASVTDFRLQNTNLLVKEIYDTIKEINPDVLFGISPQGNISNNYTQLYADVENWAKNSGYCDYIVPQIYYGFENETQPFGEVAQTWSDMTCDDVKLVVGLAFYKVNEDGEFSQNKGIIASQIEFSQQLESYGGVALYNYKNIFESENEKADVELALLKEKL